MPTKTSPPLPRALPTRGAPGPVRVAEVTVLFWVIKVLTTGMGEAASDFSVRTISPVLAVFLGACAFAVALGLQLRAGRYLPWNYWFAVAMVSVFGTMAADVLHVQFGIPYAVSAGFFAAALIAIFWTWYAVEHTVSIHSITTTRRELFYWATVLATFALGTAVGDLTAVTLHLGYLSSGVLFAVAIAVPAVAYWRGAPAIVTFWAAYVLTRPLGASFADWGGVSHRRGGLDWGTGPVSLALAALIVLAVAYAAAEPRRRGLTGHPDGAVHGQRG